jgi:hypothetical protein
MVNLQCKLPTIEEAVEWREGFRHPETQAKYDHDMKMREEEKAERCAERVAQLQGFMKQSFRRHQQWSCTEVLASKTGFSNSRERK